MHSLASTRSLMLHLHTILCGVFMFFKLICVLGLKCNWIFLEASNFFLLRKLIQEIFQDSETCKIQLPDKSVLVEFNPKSHAQQSNVCNT